MILAYSLGSVLVISLISLIGALAFLFSQKLLSRIVFFLVSLSVGVLFGDVFIHIVPEVFESLSSNIASISILGRYILFFILEKFLHWHHSHAEDEDCEDHSEVHHKTLRSVILVADGLHNFLDGMIITAAYMISVEVGIATTIAVILHELPQEFGDFGVLIHSGLSRARALFLNFVSALIALLGVFVAYLLKDSIDNFANIMLAVAAGGFVYIAGSDLVPLLHKTSKPRHSVMQLLAIILGFALMFGLVFLE